VGFTVLDVGCGDGHLAGYFDSLGIRCVGIDERAEKIAQARRNSPECEFHCAAIADRVPIVDTEFDTILVRESSAFRGSLFGVSAFEATAHLVSRLRPGGWLAFLTSTSSAAAPAAGHQSSCFVRHAQALPGTCESRDYAGRPLGKLWGGAGCSLVLFHPPGSSLTTFGWRHAVQQALRNDAGPCCPWGARVIEDSALGSAAA
jgi:SAM-dependent methyltransferase